MTRKTAFQSMFVAAILAGTSLGANVWAQSSPVTDLSLAIVSPSTQVGKASWYGESFDGRETASGELFDMYRLTAADPNLPLNSMVEVTNLENGRHVLVRVNDRRDPGPGGVIVLSKAAAANLRFVGEGTAQVRVTPVASQSATAQRDTRPRLPVETLADQSSQQSLLVWADPLQLASR